MNTASFRHTISSERENLVLTEKDAETIQGSGGISCAKVRPGTDLPSNREYEGRFLSPHYPPFCIPGRIISNPETGRQKPPIKTGHRDPAKNLEYLI